MSLKDKVLVLHSEVIRTLKILLVIASIYFFMATYNWMVFEKYQIHGNIRGINSEVDKQLGLDKVTELSLEYEQAWINSEKKFNNTLGVLCLLMVGILSFFKTPVDNINISKNTLTNKA